MNYDYQNLIFSYIIYLSSTNQELYNQREFSSKACHKRCIGSAGVGYSNFFHETTTHTNMYIHMYNVHVTYLHCVYVTCMLMILSNIHTPRMCTIRYKDNDKSYSPEEKAELFGTTGESVFIEQFQIFRCLRIFIDTFRLFLGIRNIKNILRTVGKMS